MKKLFGLFIAMIMIVSCFAALADDPIVLTYAEVNPIEDKTVVGNVALDFKAKLEELSGGQIQVDLQGSGVLGSEAQVLAGVLSQDGTVDIVRISAFALNQYGCTKSVFLSLPYVFTSEDHYWNFVHSDLAKEFLAEPTEKGMPLKGLAYGEEGFRHFFFKKEVHEIADLKDMKIRVSDDPIMQGLVKGLGANPTTVSFGELYTALQSGVVDAAEQPSGNYLSNSFQEVAPYLLKDGHTLGTIELIATQTGLNKLNEEQIGWVQEAADYAMIKCQENVVRLQEEAEATLIEKGATIIEVEDKTPWVEACKQVITDNTKGLEADLEAILALQ
ncbi:MAG: TRAP transporter substrate-binding protein [Clostridia bacterium]|nr:TRAP transporter substrate-binding protein [Clostridia bacterium]